MTTTDAAAPSTPVAAPVPPAPAPAPEVVTPEHISALHRHIDQVGAFLVKEFHAAVAFIQKAAPVIETVGTAVAAAVPGVGPIVAEVEQAAGVAAHIAACCSHDQSQHYVNGVCAQPGCSCTTKPAA